MHGLECQTIRASPVVTADETGWKVGARLHWLWAYVTPKTTVYAIHAGRGFEEAATMLGADFRGVLVRDGWSPYRRFDRTIHQTCLAHLLRRCRILITDYRERHFAPQVQRVLHHALQVRDRFRRGTISAHGVTVARGHLQNQLNDLIDRSGPRRVAQTVAAHLAVEFPAIFTFLLEPEGIDATNWRAEHALRPAVVTREVCGGNRSHHGAHTQEIPVNVLRTLQQRQLDVATLLPHLLRARQPIAALARSTPT